VVEVEALQPLPLVVEVVDLVALLPLVVVAGRSWEAVPWVAVVVRKVAAPGNREEIEWFLRVVNNTTFICQNVSK
jgi:hypothetical protein